MESTINCKPMGSLSISLTWSGLSQIRSVGACLVISTVSAMTRLQRAR